MTAAQVNWFRREPGGSTTYIALDLTPFVMDLDSHELTRTAAVLEAANATDTLDPVTLYAGECEARALLYGNLDVEQRRVYRELVEAGVLP